MMLRTWWIAIVIGITCTLLTHPIHAAKPNGPQNTITIGLAQYLNPQLTDANYTGYEADAMELFTAVKIAVAEINANDTLLANYTLALDVRNTYYDRIMSTNQITALLDPHHNPHPPPIVLGLVGYDEAVSASTVSQPYQTPMATYFTSSPSLTQSFPNTLRYCVTDQIEGFALIGLFNTLGWSSISALYNAAGSSYELVQHMQNYATALSSDVAKPLIIQSWSYTFSLSGVVSMFPDITAQLQAIKASGVRIILLSSFAADIPFILTQADALGMIGLPYVYIGSSQFCFDETLWTNPIYGRLLDGLICTQNFIDHDNEVWLRFKARWEAEYLQNPKDMFYIPTPRVSATAFDTALHVAQGLDRLLKLREECGLGPSGVSGGAPLSDLPGPILEKFHPYLYSVPFSTDASMSVPFTKSAVPMTAPYACPYLHSQVGQSRVLTQILRNIDIQGSTGKVALLPSGDRVGDLAVFSVYNHERVEVGIVSAALLNTLLDLSEIRSALSGFIKNVTMEDASDIASLAEIKARGGSSNGPPTQNGQSPGIYANTTSQSWNPASDWLHDPFLRSILLDNSTGFQPVLAYRPASYQLGLKDGETFGRSIFRVLDLDAIKFADGSNSIPLDSPNKVLVIQGIDESTKIGMFFFTGVVGIYVLLLLLFQFIYRHSKLIKATSPIMNMIFLLGTWGVLIFIYLLAFDSGELGEDQYVVVCHERIALMSVSFTLAFGSLFAKTYRLDAIFNSKHLHIHIVRDRDVVAIVGALVALDFVLLVTWLTQSPFRRELTSDMPIENPEDPNELIVYARDYCRSNNFSIYLATLVVYKGAILLMGLYLAFRIRKIAIPNLNEARYIVGSIFLTTLITALLIPISLLIPDHPNAFYLIVSIALLMLVIIVLSALFLPRVLLQCFNIKLDGALSPPAPGHGGVAHHTPHESEAARLELAQLRTKLLALQVDLGAARKILKEHGLEGDLKLTSNGIPAHTPGMLSLVPKTPILDAHNRVNVGGHSPLHPGTLRTSSTGAIDGLLLTPRTPSNDDHHHTPQHERRTTLTIPTTSSPVAIHSPSAPLGEKDEPHARVHPTGESTDSGSSNETASL